jgi:AraC family transcriptional regulator of adaptative response/methylated-DNA-[protein]-cysteine methyltransferase
MNAISLDRHTAKDPRWQRVLARDSAADGAFYFAVATTGIYCRPSCPARRPRPENVRFFATPVEAEAAGFRACKRCGPKADSQLPALIAKACRIIEQSESPPALAALAQGAGLSESHFHRLFKKTTGLTPRDYGAAHREGRLRGNLGAAGSVTAAIFDAGYNASSRLYEKSNAVLGMTPSAYRAGGPDVAIRYAVGACSLGAVLVAHSAKGICAIFVGDKADELVRDLKKRFSRAAITAADHDFAQTVAKVVKFIDAPGEGLGLPLDIRGTAFQKRVWTALQKIPAGDTLSYTALAKRLGAPRSVRAVAGACAANTIAVVIPCHRVVRSDGGLAGYRWGVERKRALLKKES